MAFNEKVVLRVRNALAKYPSVVEKRMFGGVAFMLRGQMCVGVVDDELMIRVGPDAYDAALSRPHVRKMDFTGKPLKGFVYVGKAGFKSAAGLNAWLGHGAKFALSLPPKIRKMQGPRK